MTKFLILPESHEEVRGLGTNIPHPRMQQHPTHRKFTGLLYIVVMHMLSAILSTFFKK